MPYKFFLLRFDERGTDKIHRIKMSGPVPCDLLNEVADRVRTWPGVDPESLRAVPIPNEEAPESPHFQRYHRQLTEQP